MMAGFTYTAHPARVIFADTALDQLEAEAERLGARRVLVITTPRQTGLMDTITAALGDRVCGTFAGAAMHTPVDISDLAADTARTRKADLVVAAGGGSAIGLSKAVALRTGLPQLVIPTTYSGSEMTPILGETRNGQKQTQVSAKVLPQTVLYDVSLSLALPVPVSMTSGMNAIAHAVEALYARDRNPVIGLLALEAIDAMAAALPAIHRTPDDGEARRKALYGAWLCGLCLGSVGMALHHKLCHTLGGSFALPHAETHTVLLPHALAYNAPAIPEVMDQLTGVLGSDPARRLQDLARATGAPVSLAEIGMPESGLERAADIALSNPYWNPRPLERQAILALLRRAHDGSLPRMDS